LAIGFRKLLSVLKNNELYKCLEKMIKKNDVLFDPIESFDKVKHICSIFSNLEQIIFKQIIKYKNSNQTA
jgi:hypothetical protein